MDPTPVTPPTPIAGTPSPISRAEVVTVNADGTVDLKNTASRAIKSAVPCPAGYTPTAGDQVLFVLVDGDPQRPHILVQVS